MLEGHRHFDGPNTRLRNSCSLTALICLIVIGATTSTRALRVAELASAPILSVDETRCVSDIPVLISHLSSRSYERRRLSTTRLMEYGPEAYSHLARAFRRSDSPEVRLRIERIAQHIYLRERAGEGEGFLGIEPYPLAADDDARLDPGETGIVVMRVIEGTAAQRVGLKTEDVIVRFNRRLITVDASRNGFSAMVRQLRPDTLVPIEVLRGQERLILRARLSARPGGYVRAADQAEAQERCTRWFRNRFESPIELNEKTKTASADDARD